LSSFEQSFDLWIESGKPDEMQLKLCAISESLKSVGINNKPIVWDTSKINKIQRSHPEMSDRVIIQVPNIVKKPIIIMDSKTQPNRVTLFGDVYSENRLPVMIVLELLPTSRKKNLLNEIKVVSAYSRNKHAGTQNIIDISNILYIDPDIKRTNSWLSHNQLQLPLEITKFGSIDKVSYINRDVKGNFSSNGDTAMLPEWKNKLLQWDE